jgi:uncharacterized protein YciI
MTGTSPQFIYVLRPTRIAMLTDGPSERTFGIVIYKAADESAARALADADPAVRDGIMSAEVFPFRIALQARP